MLPCVTVQVFLVGVSTNNTLLNINVGNRWQTLQPTTTTRTHPPRGARAMILVVRGGMLFSYGFKR